MQNTLTDAQISAQFIKKQRAEIEIAQLKTATNAQIETKRAEIAQLQLEINAIVDDRATQIAAINDAANVIDEAPLDAINSQLDEMWAQLSALLPVPVAASLRLVKMAIVDAIKAGKPAEARALLAMQELPAGVDVPEFEPAKAAALALFDDIMAQGINNETNS